VGSLAAAGVFVVTAWSEMVGGAVGLAILRGLDGPRVSRLWMGLLAVEAVLLLQSPPATQMLALVLAPTLGAWARVVQCHGGRLAAGTGENRMIGGVTFREFGWASVVAIGGALAVVDAVGLVAVLAAVLPTLLLRAVLHRRFGGMPAWGPSVTARVAEASVIVVLSLLSRG